MKKLAVLTALLASVLFASTAAGAETSFPDVPEGFWAEDEINYLADREVMTGYENGVFGVTDPIKRSQAARTLARIHDLDTENPEPVSFKDVSKANSAYPAIAAAVEAGYFDDGERFRPNEALTRAQMAAILNRSYDLNGEGDARFRDVSKNHWAFKDIGLIGENRITTGYSDFTYRPNPNVTRSQFAVFLARAEEESFRAGIMPRLQEFSYEQEGMEQSDIFKLMDEEGMPFTTYIPQYFEVENVSSGAADGVLAYASFTEDGEPTAEPVWRFIYPSYGKEEGVTLEDMIEEVHEYAGLDDVNLELAEEYTNPDFGEYEARFLNEEGTSYWITILEHDGTFMEWHRESPVELEEGIGPRETVVKDQWQWREE
ncbi:S-layer homology domain-containing protein [Alteribacillus sp. HJP-4]|uniref:S-layer homology domain-containing protein n=1 Tax=Alteribacillus sp. HJP-4 TaxID=2775394 RepID=UPI0035CD19FE